MHVELFLQQGNQFLEFDSARLAEVEDVEFGLVVMHRGDDAVDDVVNISVIATRGAVAENRNWFALADQFGELVNCEIGALSWSVDGEESKANAAQSVEMRISVTEKFARALCRRIRRNWLANWIVFAERYVGVDTVNR